MVYREVFETFEQAMEGILKYKFDNPEFIGCDDHIEFRDYAFVAMIWEDKPHGKR